MTGSVPQKRNGQASVSNLGDEMMDYHPAIAAVKNEDSLRCKAFIDLLSALKSCFDDDVKGFFSLYSQEHQL